MRDNVALIRTLIYHMNYFFTHEIVGFYVRYIYIGNIGRCISRLWNAKLWHMFI